jgi:Cu(I)/Ag(I) efflux system membrane protein CusA/SilA
MLTYQEQAFAARRAAGRAPASVREIREAVLEAGLRRIRPALMTTATTVIGLLPVFFTHGRGSDVMQPMALPSVGGMAVQLITLFVAPCLYCAVMERRLRRASAAAAVPSATADVTPPA